jgi:predicted PurR-regulated permease PerM
MPPRDQLSTTFFYILLLFVLYQAGRLLTPFFGPLLCALAAVIVCYPFHEWIDRHVVPKQRSFQALISVLAVLIFIVLPITLITLAVINEVHDVLPQVRMELATRLHTFTQNPTARPAWFQKLPASITDQLDFSASDIQDRVVDACHAALGHLASAAGGIARNLLGFLIDLILFLFVLFFLFRDGDRLYQQWNELIPMPEEAKARLHHRLQVTVQSVVRGSIIVGLAQALVLLIGFWVVGARAAILLACLSAIASLVPGVGTALVWVPVCAYFFLDGLYGKGLTLVCFGVGTGVVDNILRPLVMGRNTEISVLWFTFAVLGGLEVFGFKGLLLGPLIFAVLPILLDIYRTSFQASRR